MRPDPRPIALIGLSGAGKSAVARVLGGRLGTPVADLDDDIETVAGTPIRTLFARHGEAWFRAREGEALAAALPRAGVIACGGGIVCAAPSRATLAAACRVVWLEVTPASAAIRLAAAPGSRPLLAGGDGVERLAAMLAERAAHYAALAMVRVDADARPPEAVADAVLAALARAAAEAGG